MKNNQVKNIRKKVDLSRSQYLTGLLHESLTYNWAFVKQLSFGGKHLLLTIK